MLHGLFFAPIIALTATVLLLDLLAISSSLYFIFGWLDIVVHFLAGIAAGIGGLWLYLRQVKDDSNIPFGKLVVISITFGLLIAFAWEVLEFKMGRTFASERYLFDTLTDMFMTGIGGIISAMYVRAVCLRNSFNDR